jgi:hypothetical protein
MPQCITETERVNYVSTLINVESFKSILGKEITKGMLEAAEPVLQQALRDIETAMRKDLARMVTGLIESNYDISRNGHLLLIRVQLGGKEPS